MSQTLVLVEAKGPHEVPYEANGSHKDVAIPQESETPTDPASELRYCLSEDLHLIAGA